MTLTRHAQRRTPRRSTARCAHCAGHGALHDPVQVKAQLQAARGAPKRGMVGQVASVPMQVVGGTVGLVKQGLRTLGAGGGAANQS